MTKRTDIPRIIGHRGAVGHAPENTLAGFRKAKELGCDWVEFDIMLTLDHVAILHHDDALGRTVNGTGLISSATFAQIRKLDAGSWFSAEFSGAVVPSLDEAIVALCDMSMGANFEIKPVHGHERETGTVVAREVAEKWPTSMPPPLISSFSLEALETAMEAAPAQDRAILWHIIPDDWADHTERLGAGSIHADADMLTAEQAKAFNDAGVPFRCYTVNDPEEAKRLFDWGCEAIFTDYPDRFL